MSPTEQSRLRAAELNRRHQDALAAMIVPGGMMTPGEVAALFRVDPKTVTRWAAAGKVRSLRTPGGHRRFSSEEIRNFYKVTTEGSREQD